MPWNLYELYRTINKYCYTSQQFCEISKLLLKQYRNRTLFISFMSTPQNRGDCGRPDSWKSWKFQILATDPRPKCRFPFFDFIINAPDYGRENRSEIQKTHFFHFLCFFIRLRVLSMWQTFKNCAKCYFRGLGIAKISNLENFHDFETGSRLQHLPPEFFGVAKILPYCCANHKTSA